MKLSAILAVKDEEQMIEDCLKSLDFADEIVVIDTGSTDKTTKIAKKYNAKVIEYLNGKNFSDWRNKELKEAAGEWILFVDADERITPLLRKEIMSQMTDDKATSFAFAIPRKNIIFGKELTHGGWYPDYQKRLFKREALKRWTGEVHEEADYEGTLGHLENPMLHIKHETFSQMVEKTNSWSEIEAKLMFDAHHPPMTIPRFLSAMGREFWYRIVVKRAFLDGKVGISFAIYQVFSRFVSYAKLWELQEKSK
jgi:glycosyltransferase involved in cell wall biosynthesis